MGTPIEVVDIVDNTNTLYSDVLSNLYSGNELNLMLVNTKFLRVNILRTIKNFVDIDKTIFIKEFSDNPIMAYADSSQFDYGMPELTTDLVIVKKALTLAKINEHAQNIPLKYPLVLEALNDVVISKENWNDYLDEIYLNYNDENGYDDRVYKIIIEDAISTLKKWADISDNDMKENIKTYNALYGIQGYDTNTFWQEPLDLISKAYWEKFSFVLTINDYDIYNSENDELLTTIANRYFDNGYFDEIVIKINYFYWYDDFQKIVDWSAQNLKSALVSYRFNTIFQPDKNRYFDDEEASKYDDVQRHNTVEEELDMFEQRLPILLEKILTNPQTYGFELEDGYFGREGNVPDLDLNSDDFERYKKIICKIMSKTPFANMNDSFVKIFRDPEKKVFVCMKTEAGEYELKED